MTIQDYTRTGFRIVEGAFSNPETRSPFNLFNQCLNGFSPSYLGKCFNTMAEYNSFKNKSHRLDLLKTFGIYGNDKCYYAEIPSPFHLFDKCSNGVCLSYLQKCFTTEAEYNTFLTPVPYISWFKTVDSWLSNIHQGGFYLKGMQVIRNGVHSLLPNRGRALKELATAATLFLIPTSAITYVGIAKSANVLEPLQTAVKSGAEKCLDLLSKYVWKGNPFNPGAF